MQTFACTAEISQSREVTFYTHRVHYDFILSDLRMCRRNYLVTWYAQLKLVLTVNYSLAEAAYR